ncbi:indoleacetamide hydrolase [Paraburkholderia sp. J12]|uniref:indoleacetamide hydrolase n=1 Tax=Paraburkholderia sp. J12 TaxID=2805432 RepID=UPI002ABDC6DE|nr:indoleacetamide hydrolase [Paraburkholderia sp. J12]
MDLIDLSISAARDGLRSRQFSCHEYVSALLDQAAQRSNLNCFVGLDPDKVLKSARLYDARPDDRMLGGVPIAFKDNIDVRGTATTAGSKALRFNFANADAAVAASLFGAGALFFGKLNMHELAMGITNNNGWLGPCHHPFDARYSPGGSSGGSAAAVAARLVPGAIGTDTGGSVRLPAALCGIVGLRPSAGRYPQAGIAPISHTRDTAGPMARTVRDVSLLDSAITDHREEVPVDIRDLRLGVAPREMWSDLEPEVERVCTEALDFMKQAGATLVEVTFNGLKELNDSAGFPVVLYELIRDLPSYLKACATPLSMAEIAAEICSPDVAHLVRLALDQPVPDSLYAAALASRQNLQAEYRRVFDSNRIDALVFPTTPLTARPIGEDETVEFEGKRVPTFATFIRHTDYGSNAGLPAISIPAGMTRNGMPVGIELDGREGDDRRLLAIAAAIERVLPSTLQQ